MKLSARLRSWLRSLLQRSRVDREIHDELRFHIGAHADDLMRTGIPRDEALRQARLAFGGVERAKEECREAIGISLIESFAQDLRFALRMLRKNPGFTATAVLTLALGIGANTAIFSAVDEILFRPPDVAAPGRLARIYSVNRKTSTYLSSSYPAYVDFRDQARSFQNLAAYSQMLINVQFEKSAPERTSIECVTGNYFDMLGVPPVAGRALGPADDAPGAAPVAMISEDTWRTRFAAAPSAIGRTVSISGHQSVIVGVVSHRVAGLNLDGKTPPRIWISLHQSVLAGPQFATLFDRRGAIWLVLLGRLEPGASFESAQAELQTIAARVPWNGGVLSAVVFPLGRSKFWPSYRAEVQTSLAGFAIVTGLILLLACANVANLLLERALARRRELAVRVAIGAGSGRIMRQLLTEGALLGCLSCATGVLVAAGLMRLVALFPDALGLTLNVDLRVDSRALCFCIALSILTILLFALAPSLQATRLAVTPSLRGGDSQSSGRHRGSRGALVALQAAFCMILLVAGGLYLRTLWNAYSTNLGFRTGHLLTAGFSLPSSGRDGAQQTWKAQQILLQRLSSTPGVQSAAISASAILDPSRPTAKVTLAGAPTQNVTASYESVSSGFFDTIGIPFRAGRDFRSGGADTATVAIVDEALDRSLSAGRSVLGETISIEVAGQQTEKTLRVIGIVGNAKLGSVWEQSGGHLYVPGRADDLFVGFLNVRTAVPPGNLAEPINKVWNELMPLAPLYEFETGDQRLNGKLAPQRVAAGIIGSFAALALLITVVGLYGVVAFSVAQRQREIGIRMAIGAHPRNIFATVVGKAMIPTFVGLLAGVAISLPMMRIVAVKATNVSPHDVATYFGVGFALAGAAFLAAIIPARRAMRIDPVSAMRCD